MVVCEEAIRIRHEQKTSYVLNVRLNKVTERNRDF